VIDHHDGGARRGTGELFLAGRILCLRRPFLRLFSLPAGSCLRFSRGRARRDHTLATGELGQLLELALAEHGGGRERFAALRDCRGDVEAQRAHQATQLGEISSVLEVGHAGKLHTDEDRQRTR
jgi:hypothetical protein